MTAGHCCLQEQLLQVLCVFSTCHTVYMQQDHMGLHLRRKVSCRGASIDVQIEGLQTLLALALRRQSVIATRFASRPGILQDFLSHISPDVRLLAAKLLGVAVTQMQSSARNELLQHLSSNLPQLGDTGLPKTVKFEHVHGCATALGFALAAVHLRDSTQAGAAAADEQALVGKLVNLLGNGDAQLAAAGMGALGSLQLAAPLKLEAGDIDQIECKAKGASISAAGAQVWCTAARRATWCLKRPMLVNAPIMLARQ